MPAAITGILERGRKLVGNFSIAQRTIVIILAAVLALGGVYFTTWASKPNLTPLFTGLSAADASALVDELDANGTQYELTDGGSTIMVPQTEVYSLRLKAAAEGLPQQSEGGYSLLDQMGMTSSDFQQKVTYQRAIEGELAKTVNAMKGVKTATVHLAIPEDSVFVSEEKDPTASVFVEVAPGTTLAAAQVQSIIHLISAGIEGMKPEDVAVIDANGKVLSAVGGDAAAGLSDEQTGAYETRVTNAIQTMLDRMVGPGRSVVSVTAELDYDARERTDETYGKDEAPPALSESTTTEEYNGGNGQIVGGVLGPDNISVPGDTDGDSGDYSKSSQTKNNGVDKSVEHTVAAPGSVKRQSVSVAIDEEAAADLNMDDVTALVSAAAGIDTDRGDVVAVSETKFDTSAAEAAQKAIAEAKAEEKAAETQKLIKEGSIAGVILLVVIVAVIILVRRGRRRRLLDKAIDIAELQPSVEAVIEPAPPVVIADPVEVDELEVKKSDLASAADDNPAEVAKLLRDWIAPSERIGGK